MASTQVLEYREPDIEMSGIDRSPIDARVISAFRRGDESAFAAVAARFRRELHVHCYRMLGSFDEAEDLVQETMLRAWRYRHTYQGRASVRTWLYRVATNTCFDRVGQRVLVGEDTRSEGAPLYSAVPWIQPYPDALLDEMPESTPHAEARAVTRETIELAFLATIQLLPAKQRAVLLLRDVMEFSAAEAADILEDSIAAVNSALQRARTTLKQLKHRPTETVLSRRVSFDETVLLQFLMDAQQRGDVDRIVELLREDVRMTLFPDGMTWEGRDAVAAEHYRLKAQSDGQVRSIAIAANRQPAVAIYVRRLDDTLFRAWAVVLLAVQDAKLKEIATFVSPALFARFDLPLTLTDEASRRFDHRAEELL